MTRDMPRFDLKLNMADWFTSLANQAMQFADSIADTLAQQANEAQEQIALEQQKLKEEQQSKQQAMSSKHLLPWETDDESLQILSQSLMERILLLPLRDENFTIKPKNSDEVYFSFKEFVPVVLELLKIDTNLAGVHARISPKMDEEVFWFNYYCRVKYLRDVSGIEGQTAKQISMKWTESDIIFKQAPTPSPTFDRQPPAAKKDTKSKKSKTPDKKSNSDTNSKSDKDSDFDTLHGYPHRPNIVSNSSDNNKNSSVGDDDEIDLGDLDDEIENMRVDKNNNDGNNIDVDMSDLLDELDLESSDFEQVGKSDCNDAELEAQIARELAAVNEED